MRSIRCKVFAAILLTILAAALACSKVCATEPYPYAINVSGPCAGRDAIRTA